MHNMCEFPPACNVSVLVNAAAVLSQKICIPQVQLHKHKVLIKTAAVKEAGVISVSSRLDMCTYMLNPASPFSSASLIAPFSGELNFCYQFKISTASPVVQAILVFSYWKVWMQFYPYAHECVSVKLAVKVVQRQDEFDRVTVCGGFV